MVDATDLSDFVIGTAILVVAVAGYAHVIWTLRDLHVTTAARLDKLQAITNKRLDKLERILKMSIKVDDDESDSRLEAIKNVGEHVLPENPEDG